MMMNFLKNMKKGLNEMIKCKNSCPNGKFEGCCVQCPERESCSEVCEQAINYSQCKDAIIDEETGLVEFKNQQLQVLQQIANVIKMKKQCEEQEKELKDKLKQAMEKFNIKKFESDVLNLTYVAEAISTSIDSAKLKKKYPEIAEECSKNVKKSSYIKVSVK